jgi:aldose 1-epimerase
MHVISATAYADRAELVLGWSFDGSDPGYPFLLDVRITYSLSSSGFRIDTRAQNVMASQPLPFSHAWHSYFAVSDMSAAAVVLDACSHWNHLRVHNDSPIESDLIPTGFTEPWTRFGGTPLGGTRNRPTYYDDEFKATASESECPVLRTRIRDGSVTTVLWQDATFRFLQVFTGTRKALGEDAIALEAMSSAADSWNNMQGVHILHPDEVLTGSFGVYLEEGEMLV